MSHRLTTTLTEQRGAPGEQQLQVVVELRHGADGGARGAYRIGLVYGDGRRNAFDRLDLGLVHAVEKLARIGRKRLDITALSFGIQRIEHEGRFPRAGYAGHDNQLVQRDVEIKV